MTTHWVGTAWDQATRCGRISKVDGTEKEAEREGKLERGPKRREWLVLADLKTYKQVVCVAVKHKV